MLYMFAHYREWPRDPATAADDDDDDSTATNAQDDNADTAAAATADASDDEVEIVVTGMYTLLALHTVWLLLPAANVLYTCDLQRSTITQHTTRPAPITTSSQALYSTNTCVSVLLNSLCISVLYFTAIC
jgi:hypothetical protein